MLTKAVVLHHDSAQPFMAAATIVETIWKLKIELLPHPPYSSDFIPPDYQFSEHSQMCYMDADLQCTCGFVHNLIHSSQVASGSSWIKVTNVWRIYGIVKKWWYICSCLPSVEQTKTVNFPHIFNSPHIIRMDKSRRLGWVGHVACMRYMRTAKFLSRNLKGRNRLADLH
jgi:hypothetical protein